MEATSTGKFSVNFVHSFHHRVQAGNTPPFLRNPVKLRTLVGLIRRMLLLRLRYN